MSDGQRMMLPLALARWFAAGEAPAGWSTFASYRLTRAR